MNIDQIQNLITMSEANVISKEYLRRDVLGYYTDLEIKRMKLDKVLNKIESNRNEQK